MMKMKSRLHGAAFALTVTLALLLFGGIVLKTAEPVVAAPAVQVVAPRTVTLYGPTAVTTGTTYSSAPLTVNGMDFARTTNYSQVAVFVATGADSSGTVTVTLQESPDATIWTDKTAIVHTFNSSGTLTSNTYTASKTLTGATQTGMFEAPLAGEFLRVKVAATGAVTPTIKATLR